MVNAHGFAKSFQFGKLVGSPPPMNRQMIGRWPQILPNGHDVHPDTGQVSKRANDLVEGLAHADNDGRLGG